MSACSFSGCVLRCHFHPDFHVFGVTRVIIQRDSISPDNKVADTIIV